MTRDDFALTLTPLVRHGLTALGAVLAAHGLTGASDALPAFAAGITAVVVSLGWGLVEKNRLVAGLVAAAPPSDVDLVLDSVRTLRRDGASPLVVAHFAQALATVAVSELGGSPAPGAGPAVEPAPQPLEVPAAAPQPLGVFANPGDEVSGDGA